MAESQIKKMSKEPITYKYRVDSSAHTIFLAISGGIVMFYGVIVVLTMPTSGSGIIRKSR
jgi:hypothetical protein